MANLFSFPLHVCIRINIILSIVRLSPFPPSPSFFVGHGDNKLGEFLPHAYYVRPLGARTSLELIGLRQTADETVEAQYRDFSERLLFGLDRADTGEVRVAGEAVVLRQPAGR